MAISLLRNLSWRKSREGAAPSPTADACKCCKRARQHGGMKIQMRFASRDDLLGDGRPCSLSIKVGTPQELHVILNGLRESITQKFGVDKNEDLLIQAWLEHHQQWGDLAYCLQSLCKSNVDCCSSCCDSYLPRVNCIIDVRICRAELGHLLEDSAPICCTGGSPHAMRASLSHSHSAYSP